MENLNSRTLLESIRDQKVERKTYSIYLGPVWEEFKDLVDRDNAEARKEGKKEVSPSEALEALMELFLADFKKRSKAK
jgi:hypothetical protein